MKNSKFYLFWHSKPIKLDKSLNIIVFCNKTIFFQIYPDAAHSLMAVRPHLYLSMEQFFGSCFHEVADIKVTALKTKKTGR